MELLNAVEGCEVASDSPPQRRAVYRAALESLIVLLFPFAPHICEELWTALGHAPSLMRHPWPEVDRAALARDEVEVPVQVNGKLRGRVVLPVGIPQDEAGRRALAEEGVRRHVEGRAVRKIVVISDKLINIVVQ
jgi:leucyl-tRNA synthetase